MAEIVTDLLGETVRARSAWGEFTGRVRAVDSAPEGASVYIEVTEPGDARGRIICAELWNCRIIIPEPPPPPPGLGAHTLTTDVAWPSARTATFILSWPEKTLGEIARLKESDVLRRKNFGRKCTTELKCVLSLAGLSLAPASAPTVTP